MANPYDVTVLNTTVVGKKPPREVTSAPTEHLAAGFGRGVGQSELSDGPGLVASNRGRLVVVAFPDGLLASYESDLPTWRPAPMNTKLWSQPVFVAAMGLIGLWQFYRSRGHAAMGSSWGGPSVGKGGDGGGLDPKLLEQLMGGEGRRQGRRRRGRARRRGKKGGVVGRLRRGRHATAGVRQLRPGGVSSGDEKVRQVVLTWRWVWFVVIDMIRVEQARRRWLLTYSQDVSSILRRSPFLSCLPTPPAWLAPPSGRGSSPPWRGAWPAPAEGPRRRWWTSSTSPRAPPA